MVCNEAVIFLLLLSAVHVSGLPFKLEDGCTSPSCVMHVRLRRQAEAPGISVEDARCNSESLQRIILENVGEDVKQSKLKIMEAAEAVLGGTFNVICAKGDFSYITSTRLYCLAAKDDVKCYAFLADTHTDGGPRKFA